MLSLTPATQIFLVTGATDMRKSFNGLVAIVENVLGRDPLTGHLFVFTNRLRNRLKLLFWDRTGLWVCAKRLEKGTFFWPEAGEASVEMTAAELALILDGIDLKDTRKRRWYRKNPEQPTPAASITEIH
jgi:transposase